MGLLGLGLSNLYLYEVEGKKLLEANMLSANSFSSKSVRELSCKQR